MPGSAVEGKELTRNFIIEHNLKTFLDIGAGEGTYYDALNGIGFYAGLEPIQYDLLDGVESWGPYIGQYGLYNKYNKVIIADAVYLDWSRLPKYDLTFLGDVIEHMYRGDGERVIAEVAKISKYFVVSLPIYGYAQHVGWEGNWFETHVEQYSDESIKDVLKDYEILEEMQGAVIGVYIVKGI